MTRAGKLRLEGGGRFQLSEVPLSGEERVYRLKESRVMSGVRSEASCLQGTRVFSTLVLKERGAGGRLALGGCKKDREETQQRQ